MKLFRSSRDREDELLSAYLDDELSLAERARLEDRLKTDSRLRAALQGLGAVKTHLDTLPQVKPPRNFTLTPKMAESLRAARRPSRLIPALNWATALAAVFLAVLLASDLSMGLSFREAASPPMAANAPEDGLAVRTVGETDSAIAEELATDPAAAGALEFAAPAESPVEPLTGAPGSGVGGGGGEGPVPAIPQTTEGGSGEDTAAPSIAALDDGMTATPTEDPGLQRLESEEGPTQAVEPTPVPAPIETPAQAIQQGQEVAAYSSPALNPIRLAQLGLAALLIGLVTLSILLRRR